MDGLHDLGGKQGFGRVKYPSAPHNESWRPLVRALQAFIRLQDEPERELSLGAAAADAIALVSRVLPVHDTEFSVSGDATVVASPGETQRRLVELLVEELDRPDRGATIELVVRDNVVTVGDAELRL